MPQAKEALQLGRRSGNCWIASDATQWVVEFKLQAVGMSLSDFDEVFTLDRCHASKGHKQFWNKVKAAVPDKETHLIYIDNRDDRLVSASEVLTNCSFVQVVAEDHPTSLGLAVRHGKHADTCIFRVSSLELPSRLESIARSH